MKNVSSAFKNELKNGNRKYIKSLKLTLNDGTELLIDNSKLWQNGLKIESATSNQNSFDIGAAIIGQLTLTLNNITDEYSGYDFTDCIASNVRVGLKLPNNTTEYLSYGKYYLNEAKYNGSIITLTFYDCLYKFDKSYSQSNLSYPATLGQILRDACSVCGVSMGTVEFDNDDYVVQSRPDDKSLTFRQVLKWIGEISVHYFFADEEGRLSVGWYDLESQNNQIEEAILQDTDGENILDTNNDEIITSIESGIRHFVSLSAGLDDVVITGVRVLHDVEGDSGTETITYQAGSDGYLIEISKNKLIQGDEGTNVANIVAAKLVGLRFRAYQATGLSDPTREVGDTVWLIDRKNNRYKSVITNNTFQPGNFQNFSCGAVSPARNSATRYSQITQVYVDYRKDIEKERTDREKALDELTERIDGSSGLFTTEEIQEDGSTIFYLHNKPMLSESDIIWKMTAEAWGVSTDGGKTYNAGMTVDGDTIVRILTAVGVNADWIKTGAISVEDTDGNETFYVDTETGQVRIVANSFSLKGKSISEIADEEVNDFADNVYSPTIANLQSQIDTAVNELDASLNQEGIFNRLTNNGTVQGIFLEDGDLYINATYIKSGTLTLGGTNNQYGKLSIRNASNTEIGRWNKDGVYIYGGEIYSNADDSEASIVGGRIYVSHTGTDLGQIGANFFSSYESYKGITFGLRTSGSYMSWGAQESSYGDYVVKLLYSSKNFSDFLADTLYVGCNMDFRDYYIQNAVIDGFSCKNSFKIPNNTDCNIYSDVNFHNWEIQNVKIDNLLAINGYTTENGTFRVVTSITNRADGGINWTSGYVTIRDGIITSWPS